MAKRFPKQVLIKIETDPNDKELSWFIADTEMASLVSMGVTEKIAIYQLLEIREATGVVSHKKSK